LPPVPERGETPTHARPPKAPAQRTRSLSEGGPAGGALDLDFHHHRHDARSRQDPSHPPHATRQGRRRRYANNARGAQRRRADTQQNSNHQRPAKPRRGPVRSAAKHRDVGGQTANNSQAHRRERSRFRRSVRGSRTRPVGRVPRVRFAPGLADALYRLEVCDRRGQQLLQAAEVLD